MGDEGTAPTSEAVGRAVVGDQSRVDRGRSVRLCLVDGAERDEEHSDDVIGMACVGAASVDGVAREGASVGKASHGRGLR
jgi:hypothetical protein